MDAVAGAMHSARLELTANQVSDHALPAVGLVAHAP